MDDCVDFINQFISTKTPINRMLGDAAFQNNPVISQLKKFYLQSNLFTPRSPDQVLIATEILAEISNNNLMKALIYSLCADASYKNLRKEEARILLNKAKSSLDSNSPPIFMSYIRIQQNMLENLVESLPKIALEEYEKFHHTSERYFNILLTGITVLSTLGMARTKHDSEFILDKYESTLGEELMDMNRFRYAVETFDQKEAERLFLKRKYAIDKDLWAAIYHIYSRREPEVLTFLKEFEVQNEEQVFYAKILTSIHFLTRGDITKARESLPPLDDKSWGFLSSSYMVFAGIRVELCSGNAEAAMQLLKKKRENVTHLLDDYCFFRIERLNGNHENASMFLNKAMKQCEQHSQLNRLFHEMDLSFEIERSEIFKISNFIKEQNKSNPSIQLPHKKSNHGFLGNSLAAIQVREKIQSLAKMNVPILICGETGTGKEVVAKEIHLASDRKDEAFLAINCGAITDSLLQSELFGHEEGAFTSANKAHKGIFVEAKKGTVFLDEIGEISHSLQVALLRVLENNEIRPVGGTKQIPLQCQIIAATNADLDQMTKEGKFRTDLLYRLRRMDILIPPLRKRKEDIILLAQHFLDLNRDFHTKPQLSQKLKTALTSFDWPGNVRQLRNEIEKMDLLHSRKNFYDLEDFDLFKDRDIQPTEHTIMPPTQESHETNSQANEKLDRRNRLKSLKNLFLEKKELSRKEISKILNISLPTATTDLKILLEEGFILKIEPTPSTRSHYFILAQI